MFDLLRKCTVCGRLIPNGETVDVTKTRAEGSIDFKVECALHTDHEIASSWHGDDDG